jgi:hypothetical protein
MQAIVTEYRFLQADKFWTKYSSPAGQRLSYSEISDRINRERQERDLEASNAAKLEYGSSFADHFTYRRGRQTFVMTNPRAIARRFYELKAFAY